MFQEPCTHCFLLRLFHPTKVIFHQCQIYLMTSLHQMLLHSNPHWLTSFSLNLLNSPPLYYNMTARLKFKRGTENPGFYYWLAFSTISEYKVAGFQPDISQYPKQKAKTESANIIMGWNIGLLVTAKDCPFLWGRLIFQPLYSKVQKNKIIF